MANSPYVTQSHIPEVCTNGVKHSINNVGLIQVDWCLISGPRKRDFTSSAMLSSHVSSQPLTILYPGSMFSQIQIVGN